MREDVQTLGFVLLKVRPVFDGKATKEVGGRVVRAEGWLARRVVRAEGKKRFKIGLIIYEICRITSRYE